MGSRNFKNDLRLRHKAFGPERRKNLYKEVVKDSTPIPNPVNFEDIDIEFKRWVEEDLYMSFEGKEVPTVALFSNQRFSEYMQSWQNTDDKKNMLVNFKTISRENNPKTGTINGETKNVPGNRTYLLKRVEARDKNDRKYYIDYRMKQPFSIDLIYTVSIVTNKYVFLNEFNTKVNDIFKAITAYIRPKGHYMSMKLTDISDESEYSIDNRQFYSQSYNITVRAYIITEDSFTVEERPELKLLAMDTILRERKKNSYADIEEFEKKYIELPLDKQCATGSTAPYYYTPIEVTIHIDFCDNGYKFNIDCDFQAEEMYWVKHIDDYNTGRTISEPTAYKFYINDNLIEHEDICNVRVNNGDEIRISGVLRKKPTDSFEMKIIGYNYNEINEKETDLE